VIAISSDEETELFGVKKITEKMRELNIVPRLTIVGEPTNSDICVKGKSCLAFKIRVTGKSCHSSKPQDGVNANYVLARLILFIEKLCGKFKDTTTSCNIISGGKADNIICDSSEMIFDVRSFNRNDISKILLLINKRIRRLKKQYKGVRIELENKLDILPFKNKNKKKTLEICGLIGAREEVFLGGCEAGYFQNLGGDAIVFGVGDLSLAHKPNEYAMIDELKAYYDKLEIILKTL
jgi:acetylornithine deacetylase